MITLKHCLENSYFTHEGLFCFQSAIEGPVSDFSLDRLIGLPSHYLDIIDIEYVFWTKASFPELEHALNHIPLRKLFNFLLALLENMSLFTHYPLTSPAQYERLKILIQWINELFQSALSLSIAEFEHRFFNIADVIIYIQCVIIQLAQAQISSLTISHGYTRLSSSQCSEILQQFTRVRAKLHAEAKFQELIDHLAIVDIPLIEPVAPIASVAPTLTNFPDPFVTRPMLLLPELCILFNIRTLFHASQAAPDQLSTDPLDLSFSRGGRFGQGLYFASDIRKAMNYVKQSILFKPRNEFYGHIFIALVPLGNIQTYENGHCESLLRAAPAGYDSVKGNITGHDEYIIYHPNLLIPMFLLYKPENSLKKTNAKPAFISHSSNQGYMTVILPRSLKIFFQELLSRAKCPADESSISQLISNVVGHTITPANFLDSVSKILSQPSPPGLEQQLTAKLKSVRTKSITTLTSTGEFDVFYLPIRVPTAAAPVTPAAAVAPVPAPNPTATENDEGVVPYQ